MGAVSDEVASEAGGTPAAGAGVPGHRRSSRPAHRIVWRHAGRAAEPADVDPRALRRPSELDARPLRYASVDLVDVRVAAERQRIAGALHDDVSSVLFAISAGVERARALHAGDADELRRALARVGDQVVEATDKLRAVLRSCTPVEPTEGVPAAAQRDLDDLAERSGLTAHLVIRGRARPLTSSADRVVLSCLRQALYNIERHADARTVIVTLHYAPEEIVLIVQDDGRGLPRGFEPRVVPHGGHHWGTASMARQVEQHGGSVELTGADEGGTRLRVRMPA